MTTTAPGAKVQFAADHDSPIPYMQRTRDYYQLLGFAPYRWAHFVDVPWAPLRTPLDRARVSLITTAAPCQPGAGDQGPGAAYTAAAKIYQVYSMPTETVPDLRISHVGYDRLHTTAADPNTYLPLAQLKQAGIEPFFGPEEVVTPFNRRRIVFYRTPSGFIFEAFEILP